MINFIDSAINIYDIIEYITIKDSTHLMHAFKYLMFWASGKLAFQTDKSNLG